MKKPNCKCTEEILPKIKTMEGKENAIAYFKDQNILGGALTSVITIEEKILTKSGKERKKISTVSVVHLYCPFCGRLYLNEIG